MEFKLIVECFILYWGEMGFCWGVNCIVVQIYVLLYLVGWLMEVEEIVMILGVVCFNVSNSLKEFQLWKLVWIVYLCGDWCDYFDILIDIWELFKLIVEGCCQCEIDLIIVVLKICLSNFELVEEDVGIQVWIKEMLEFIEIFIVWLDEML